MPGVAIEALTLERTPPKLSGIAALKDVVVESLFKTITTSLLPFQVKLFVVNNDVEPETNVKLAVVELTPLNLTDILSPGTTISKIVYSPVTPPSSEPILAGNFAITSILYGNLDE